MRAFMKWLAGALFLASTGAMAQVTFDGATGIVNIPSVKVGSDMYTNVTLQHLGNYVFKLQGAAGPVAPTATFDASYDLVSGILSIPTVAVGSATYIDVTLQNTGDFTFELRTATEKPPAGAGSAAECLNPQYLATGTKFLLNYRTTKNGTTVETSKSESEIKGTTAFNGQSALEINSKIEILTGSDAGQTVDSLSYIRVQDLDVLALGSVTQASMLGFTATITTTFAPPLLQRYSLTAGQSVTTNYIATQTTTGLPFNLPPTTTEFSDTFTFLGFENVAVPAGSFAAACKWTHASTANGETTTSTQWLTRKGALLKNVDGDSVIELTSGSVNGGAVDP